MKAEGLFDPAEWYGSETINSISAGVRMDVGAWPARMGRYGVSE
jgi:hypothetical protein